MRHFVAYHNTERMGRPLAAGEPLRLLTNKPVEALRNNAVWFVVGDGAAPKRYDLGSVFIVDDVGEARETGLERYARGHGHVFQQPSKLNDLAWFPDFFKSMAHFSLGVQEVKEPRFIQALVGLAAQAGYRPDEWQRASITPDAIQEAFAVLQFQRDERRFPDERRRAQFRAGWEDATKRGDVDSAGTPERLTWRNLGCSLGRHFGDQTLERIHGAFDTLARLYEPPHAAPTAPNAAPSAEQYVVAFRKLANISDSQVQMLRLHYHAPARTITASQMARAIGYDRYSIANSQYGRLGRLVGYQLQYNPMKERLGTLVTFERRQGEWHWVMRPEVTQALELLGWVAGADLLLPEEIAATASLVEGAVCRVSVNAYERNPEARRRCIERHGTRCCICGFSFGAVYGGVAEGYIHVHHLRPLSEIGGEYTVDPVEDLRPVCPNCHAVLHRRIPSYSIEEVRAFLRQSVRA